MELKRVLIGCEESQIICMAFRKLGIEAYSCDLESCSGGHPEWHIQDDVLNVIKYGWRLAIFHPPCTYLSICGNRWMSYQARIMYPYRSKERREAIEFFMKLYNADIDMIAVENPVGIMSTTFRKPDQYIQPYQFGDPHSKKTGLWLKNLPLLKHTDIVDPYYKIYNSKYKKCGKSKYSLDWNTGINPDIRSKVRSRTYEGIATAMAEQWGILL